MTDTSNDGLRGLCDWLDRRARLVSNMGSPETDNNYGRCFAAIEALQARVTEVEQSFAGVLAEKFAAQDEADFALADVARLRAAALPFVSARTDADMQFIDNHGRHWRCLVTAHELNELRAAVNDAAPENDDG